ncbi:putative P-type Ca(2+) transporter [Helianthus debilis subsp. tardiflorus]
MTLAKTVPTDEELLIWGLLEGDLVLLAIVGLKDPCQPGVKDVVQLGVKASAKAGCYTPGITPEPAGFQALCGLHPRLRVCLSLLSLSI